MLACKITERPSTLLASQATYNLCDPFFTLAAQAVPNVFED